MALIKCSECGREISSAVAACPGCGAPAPAASSGTPPAPVPALSRPKRKGLWIALAIVAALAVLGVVAFVVAFIAFGKLDGNRQVSRRVMVHSDIQAITSQLKLYDSINGFLPTTEQGLQALVTEPTTEPRPTRWYQLFRKLPDDPWHNAYIYRQPRSETSRQLRSFLPRARPHTRYRRR